MRIDPQHNRPRSHQHERQHQTHGSDDGNRDQQQPDCSQSHPEDAASCFGDYEHPTSRMLEQNGARRKRKAGIAPVHITTTLRVPRAAGLMIISILLHCMSSNYVHSLVRPSRSHIPTSTSAFEKTPATSTTCTISKLGTERKRSARLRNQSPSSISCRLPMALFASEEGDLEDDDDNEKAESIDHASAALAEARRLVRLSERAILAQQKQLNVMIKLLGMDEAQDDAATVDIDTDADVDADVDVDAFPSTTPAITNSVQSEPTEDDMIDTVKRSNKYKVKIFIDGTWLYYSLFERSSSGNAALYSPSRSWTALSYVDWSKFTDIVRDDLQAQLVQQRRERPPMDNPAGGDGTQSEPIPEIEIVGVSAFTSMRPNTKEKRKQMFTQMQEHGFKVHVLETVGHAEKCIDIQLAVDMVYESVVPDSFDIGVIVTGDKDFLPAMIRTRQNNRRVALMSMGTACHQDLYTTPMLRDFRPIWLEDHFDDLILESGGDEDPPMTTYTLMKIVCDFIKGSGQDRVFSRDVGRFLKEVKLGRRVVAQEVKARYGSLKNFFEARRDVFRMDKSMDRRSAGYWISATNRAENVLRAEQAVAPFSDHEKELLKIENLADSLDCHFSIYEYTESHRHMKGGARRGRRDRPRHSRELITIPSHLHERAPRPIARSEYGESHDDVPPASANPEPVELSAHLTRDYTTCTVVELKEYCRERGLKVSGLKKVLLERIQDDVKEQMEELQSAADTSTASTAPWTSLSSSSSTEVEPPPSAEAIASAEYLKDCIRDCIVASGRPVSSRDLGRYLRTQNPSEPVTPAGRRVFSALHEIKSAHGSIWKFLSGYRDLFFTEFVEPRSDTYAVGLVEDRAHIRARR